MSAPRLEKMDWGSHVPSVDGTLDGDDFKNLESIARSVISKMNEPLAKKCWNFVNQQPSGKLTRKAAQIIQNSFPGEVPIVTFTDNKKERVFFYEVAALKKDYPNFKMSDLKKISFDEFKILMAFLYEDKEIDKGFEVLRKLGIQDPVLQFKYRNVFPDKETLDDMSGSDLARLLQVVLDKKEIRQELVDQISKQLSRLDSRKRDDIRAVVEMNKIINKTGYLDTAFTDRIAFMLGDASQKAKAPGILSQIFNSILNFIHASLLNSRDADRDFILSELRSVPKLTILVDHNTTLELLEVLENFPNIKNVIIDVTLENSMIPDSNETINKEVRNRFRGKVIEISYLE